MKRTVFFILVFIMLPSLAEAQCSMCRAVLESEAEGGTAEGINDGILYLMAIPYIIVATIFFFVYRQLKK